MSDKGKVFDLIVQRSVVTGQVELDLGLDLNLNSNNNTQAPEAVAGALRQTDYKTNYKYQNTRHWH
jgi:hypothetical protein